VFKILKYSDLDFKQTWIQRARTWKNSKTSTYCKICFFNVFTTRSMIAELNLCQRSYNFSRTPRFYLASRLTTAKNTRSRTIHLFASRTPHSASRRIFLPIGNYRERFVPVSADHFETRDNDAKTIKTE